MPFLPGRGPTNPEAWTPEKQAHNFSQAKKHAPKKKPKLCVDCGEQPKQQGHPLWCRECWLRRQPIEVQAKAAAQRAAKVPEAEWRATVPEAEWPDGRRWCSGCQTMVSFLDVPEGGTRCRPCTSTAAHRSRIERVYNLDRADFETLYALQGGRCAVCRKTFVSKRPNIDHDHTTNRVRGLLCDTCNHDLLGAAASAGDASSAGAIRILLAAIYYLRFPPADGDWKPEIAADPPPF